MDIHKYSLVIITDGINPKNTRIYFQGKQFNGIQYIKLNLDANNVSNCDISFVPLETDSNLNLLENDLKNTKDKLIILAGAHGTSCNVLFNHKPIRLLQKLELIADIDRLTVDLKIINDNKEIQQISITDLPKYI